MARTESARALQQQFYDCLIIFEEISDRWLQHIVRELYDSRQCGGTNVRKSKTIVNETLTSQLPSKPMAKTLETKYAINRKSVFRGVSNLLWPYYTSFSVGSGHATGQTAVFYSYHLIFQGFGSDGHFHYLDRAGQIHP